ncbi:MAG: UDP-N-acetylmuramate--L-alanine ligase [Patescibacteria group bacterium]|nr:UDP-N-acetylmuramate--L-alanine ligase [Patescibacteria group bacterium]
MKIHFIGIGGIGISALAKYYLYQGNEISGSDLVYPADVFSSDELKKIKFYHSHKFSNISQKTDLVIYSLAIKNDNPEIIKAKKLNLPLLSYPQALGNLTKKYFTIAVSGMHGKSTTTAMIAQILIKSKLDPTVIIGSKVKNFGLKGEDSNFRYGKSNYLVIEADEYKAGFLNHYPNILVITNIEAEHLDYYRNENNIFKAFKKFLLNLKGENKFLVVNKDDAGVRKLLKISQKIIKGNNIKKIYYTLKDNSAKLKLRVPGNHNLSNAQAAFKVGQLLKIKKEFILKSLENFRGIWRRLEYKGNFHGAKIFDDYGHHPTEIKSTIQAAREILPKNGRLFIIFQPHQYYRTYYLFNQFLDAFDLADYVGILDIYTVAGRESKSIINKVNSQKLVNKISQHKKNVFYFNSFSSVIDFLKNNLRKNDVCLIMGAGDVYQLTQKLLKEGG